MRIPLLIQVGTITAAGFAAIGTFLYLFGPLVQLGGFAPFRDTRIVYAVIALLVVLWLVATWIITRNRKARDSQLIKGIAEVSEEDKSAAAADEEVSALREKLSVALTTLKKARGAKGYLYEQPWYAIIGPPGAGKTTALIYSGLKFPLAAEMGQGPLTGVGGTRQCDWWFTEEAVLLDTAGRYTTQDSDAAVDKAGWDAFLDLLKRTRPRQPLNGLIVAIPLSDDRNPEDGIATGSAADRLGHARLIRKRIKELTERLQARIPVYCLFTKSDLVAGFSEFFEDLDRERRTQVWGHTFPLVKGRDAGPVGKFAEEFRALVARLDERLIDRMQAERSPERRTLIAGFPAQIASLEHPLNEFLTEAFGGSRLDPAPFLRGFYFASGTQEGTPIDRLTGAMAREFGVDARRAPSLKPEAGRAYFLTRLLKDVVFHEAMLVVRDPAATRRRAAIALGAWLLVALVTAGGAFALWRSESGNENAVVEAENALGQLEREINAFAERANPQPRPANCDAAPAALNCTNDDELVRVRDLLDRVRDLPFGVGGARPATGGFGLDQSEKLTTGARLAYRRALDRVLLPRLIWRLEKQIRGFATRPEALYEGLRVYLMLGARGPLDAELVRAWMQLDWQTTFPSAPQRPLREGLMAHLNALLAAPLPQYPLDGTLTEDARRVLSRVPVADRTYARIRSGAGAARVAPWTPAQAAGASGARVFVRGSGRPLTEGIPGFYTVDGFHRVLLPALGNASREVAEESWVLGATTQIGERPEELLALERDVVAAYVREYIAQWDAMLADLNVVPWRDTAQAQQDLYLLASPQSPLRDLLNSIVRQLTLSQPPDDLRPREGQPAPGGAPTSRQQRLQEALPTGAPPGQPAPAAPGSEVDDRYKPLRDTVAGGAGAPIEAVLRAMDQLQQALARVAAPGAPPAAPTGLNPPAQLATEAQRQPQPLSRWIQTIAAQGNARMGAAALGAATDKFRAEIAPYCTPAIVDTRFPFVNHPTNDIPLQNFAELFAPGGRIDQFFTTTLQPFVRFGPTPQAPWTLQDVGGTRLPVSDATLDQFRRAQRIRDTFFGPGGTTPTVTFDIWPESLGAGATQVQLIMGPTTISYAFGPPRATTVTWPGTTGMNQVELVFDPPPNTGEQLRRSGPWALFRVFAVGNIRRTGAAEQFQLTFQNGDRSASFNIRAGSVFNPFDPALLRQFRCPTFP